MRAKRLVLISAAALAVTAGAGGAIAAVTRDDGKQTEQSILNDAAKRLNVSPDQLRSALAGAEDAQLDQAVKDGKLTQQQADAIKAHRKADGRVLGMPPGGPGFGPGGPGGPGFGHGGLGFRFGPGGALDAAATALGLKLPDLLTKLRSGKSVADVAKEQNKSLSDIKAAITTAVTKELDQAVKDGKLTDAQRKEILSELGQHLDDLLSGKGPMGPGRMGGPGQFHGPRGHWR